MGTVAIFLEAYDNATDWDVLNRVICAWRDDEEKTRAQCGLDSVSSVYTGCTPYTRGLYNTTHNTTYNTTTYNTTTYNTTFNTTTKLRKGRKQQESSVRTPALSAHDLILHNHRHMAAADDDGSYIPDTIQTDVHDELTDLDWEAFIAEQYDKDAAKDHRHGRELLNYDNVTWFNYFPMTEVRTEYYYRYSGTETIPPCYGNFQPNANRAGTNNWRVMKDPIRVSRRQIEELHRLLRERIATLNDPLAACQPDTAAKVDNTTGHVDTARPLQSFHPAHYEEFCACRWKSHWIEDQAWCSIANITARYDVHPYNFDTPGF
jgi:hypothetical protein